MAEDKVAMKKRVGIFCLYDSEGIVDNYILYLINSLKGIIDDLIIVINGNIMDCYLMKLYEATPSIVVRENTGFDAGAYKEIILNHIDLNDCDELVLFNSTFYGPFIEWNTVFDEMRSKNFDFWALDVDNTYGSLHLGSYFLVFERKILESDSFIEFWSEMKIPVSYYDTFKFFEEPLLNFFATRGFSYSDWYSENGGKLINKSPIYRYYSIEDLVTKYRFPIIKYKCFSVVQYTKLIPDIEYIKKETSYDYRLIEQHHSRLENSNKIYPFSKKSLDNFLDLFDEVFIFGHGVYGQGIYEYCKYCNKKVLGFTVSKATSAEEIDVDTIRLENNQGMIIALGMGAVHDIVDYLKDKFNSSQLLIPTSIY